MAGLTPVVIAIDGGGSKTDIVAIDLDGRIISHARGGGTNPQTQGWTVTRAILDDLRRMVLDDISGRPILDVQLYLAGLDFREEIDEAGRMLADWSKDGFFPRTIDNDLFALLRAGTLAPDAVAVICGTGINAVGVRADGKTARFPAVGDLSGDWGGGSFLGTQVLWHAARAEDGRGSSTALTRAVCETFDGSSVLDVIKAFHFGVLEDRTVNRLAPVLFAVAEDGDAVARSIVLRQAEEIVLMATAAMRHLDLLAQEDVPVVLGGGVLAARPPLLEAEVLDRLSSSAPHSRAVWVTAPPVLGAGLAALEAVDATDTAIKRFRAQISAADVSGVGGSAAASGRRLLATTPPGSALGMTPTNPTAEGRT